MEKYVEIRKIRKNTMKKGSHEYENENANKVKRKCKLNVDEQQYAIKH